MVAPEDLTFILGDVGINCAMTWQTIKSLNGHKILILGNHDLAQFWPDYAIKLFDAIYPYLLLDNTLLIHKPGDRVQFQGYSWVIHGHLHTREAEILVGDQKDYIQDTRRLNCAADMINLCPQTIQGLLYLKSEYIFESLKLQPDQ